RDARRNRRGKGKALCRTQLISNKSAARKRAGGCCGLSTPDARSPSPSRSSGGCSPISSSRCRSTPSAANLPTCATWACSNSRAKRRRPGSRNSPPAALTSSSITSRLPPASPARASTGERRDEPQKRREKNRVPRQAQTGALSPASAQDLEDQADAPGFEGTTRQPAQRGRHAYLAAVVAMAARQWLPDLAPLHRRLPA